MAFAIFGRIDIQGAATPVMRKLSENLGETIHIGMLDGAGAAQYSAVAAALLNAAKEIGDQLG